MAGGGRGRSRPPAVRPPRPEDLHVAPNALAPHYSAFRVDERLLLTGHSHQAWPDRGFRGQRQAWLDAAEHVDAKWDAAFERADRVRRGWSRLLDDDDGLIALGSSTHELVLRFLSALPLRDRPRLVTTDGEFHTLRRQLDRLAEEGLEVIRVEALPAATLAARLAEAVDDRTAAVAVSCVLFRNAHVVPGLRATLEACEKHGAELLVDAYHALNAIEWSLREEGLGDAFAVGGGYKYCQLGEGNCFLKVPPGRELRPAITGWFAEFATLEASPGDGTADGAPGAEGRVAYADGAARWAGATYDPTSHYRASEVLDFFDEAELTPELLRAVSRHQVGVLAERFDALDLDPGLVDRDRSVSLDRIAGFLALRSPRAGDLAEALRERGVHCDHRDDVLRLGPAPYLHDGQLEAAIAALGEAAEKS